MAASKETVEAVCLVIRTHCSPRQIDAIIRDLLLIRGNKSFRDTITALCERLQQ